MTGSVSADAPEGRASSEATASSGGPEAGFPATGEPGPTTIRAISGDQGRALTLADLPAALADPASRVWVDLADPTRAHLADVAALLGLHPLVAENIGERSKRAKIEQVDDHLRIVLFAIEYVGEVRPMELDFILGERFLLTVHGSEWDLMLAPHLRSGVDSVLARGPDYLFYAFGDWIVDGSSRRSTGSATRSRRSRRTPSSARRAGRSSGSSCCAESSSRSVGRPRRPGKSSISSPTGRRAWSHPGTSSTCATCTTTCSA